MVRRFRGEVVEALFRGNLVVCDSRNIETSFVSSCYTYIRSASKPFQTIPLITTGAYERFSLSPRHLAIASGSHNGQDIHQRTVLEMLSMAGLEESNLRCGTHPPMTKQAREEIGDKITQLSNNCSGKHASMMLICKHMGWDMDSYLDISHPIQQLMLDTVSKICESKNIKVGIDGCGVPVFAMDIENMAIGFSKIANPDTAEQEYQESIKMIKNAINEFPDVYAGTDRIATKFVKDNPDSIYKSGAQGVGCFAFDGKGVAFKLECGEEGSIFTFTVANIAKFLGANTESLGEFLENKNTNHLGQTVGVVEFNIERVG